MKVRFMNEVIEIIENQIIFVNIKTTEWNKSKLSTQI